MILRLPTSFTKTEVDEQKEEESTDTTLRMKHLMRLHYYFTRPYAWGISYTCFPLCSIRSYRYIETLGVSLKSPKESPHNMFAVVCANGRLEQCLRRIDRWIGGTGPNILQWLRKNSYDRVSDLEALEASGKKTRLHMYGANIAGVESPRYTLDEKKRVFKGANTNYGISALCLSGGASFGYYHFRVVKAFLDAEKPLPRVITGTSAGGLIAALSCTRTDDELKILLVPELANRLTACEDLFKIWVRRAWKTGARFDSIIPGPSSD
ncbi:hypothetical protein C8R41DRAFT_866285 [Lentinula lateritia]|uniref:PNPLA domain-containing protein n=1 Tax=Lentinula lateritia TaxID=40482 RepID=A0ABQ8VJC3_9AGAR|nr:hypothetical protein C8R41DRAFT_866285 [Lentinula lateritia]